MRFWRKEEIIEITILKRIAHQIFSTINPGTRYDVPKTRSPFMTSIKRPRVISVIGRVSKIRIGLIKAFAIPRTSPTIKAVRSELIATPGRRYAASQTASPLMRIKAKILII